MYSVALVTKQIPPGRQIRLAYLAQYVNTVPGMTGNQTGLDIKMDIVVTAVNSCRFVMDVRSSNCKMTFNKMLHCVTVD